MAAKMGVPPFQVRMREQQRRCLFAWCGVCMACPPAPARFGRAGVSEAGVAAKMGVPPSQVRMREQQRARVLCVVEHGP